MANHSLWQRDEILQIYGAWAILPGSIASRTIPDHWPNSLLNVYSKKRLIHQGMSYAKRVILPFFDGLSLYDVATFFWRGMIEGAVPSRASAISFSFFLALFPGVIFLFTLIPFIPLQGFQEQLFLLLQEVLPPTSFDAAYTTINDILTIRRGNLLSVTIIATLIFSTNGTLPQQTPRTVFLCWVAPLAALPGQSSRCLPSLRKYCPPRIVPSGESGC